MFWKVYAFLSRQYPEFLTSSRNYPGLPYRFRKRTIRAVDSTTIQLTAFSMGRAKHRRQKAAADILHLLILPKGPKGLLKALAAAL